MAPTQERGEEVGNVAPALLRDVLVGDVGDAPLHDHALPPVHLPLLLLRGEDGRVLLCLAAGHSLMQEGASLEILSFPKSF